MKLLKPKLPPILESSSDIRSLLVDDELISGLLVESADLTALRLVNADISDSKITSSALSLLSVTRLRVTDSVFTSSDLSAAALGNSSWRVVEVLNCRCSGLQLNDSKLQNVYFKASKLDLANFRFSELSNVIFEDCVIDGVDFYGARLSNVAFQNCVIKDMELSNSHLKNVDMTTARFESVKGLRHMNGVTITYDQLMQLAPALAAEIGMTVDD